MARTAKATAANVATAAVTVAAPANRKALQAANAYKYASANNGRAMAGANVVYTLTALGAATAANGGAGKQGNPTVMGCVAVAAAHVAAKGRPLTLANICAAMQALPALKAAISASKASAKYAAGGNYCHAWLAGYVRGAARNAHGLLATVTA